MIQISFFSRILPIAAISLVSAIAIAKPARSNTFTIPIDPAATYLKTADIDSFALDTVAIDLASLGINGEDFITLEQLGDFAALSSPDYPETSWFMTGLFSTSAELLPSQFLNRVPGAIEFGEDFESLALNDVDNDITEDFRINAGLNLLQVPDLAQYLFVAAADNYWGDNRDWDNDYAIRITTEQQSIPEPSIILGLLLFGGLGAKSLHRNKSL